MMKTTRFLLPFVHDILRLPTKERVSFVQELRRRFSHWLAERSKGQGKLSQVHEFLDEEIELSMKT